MTSIYTHYNNVYSNALHSSVIIYLKYSDLH